ncbi:MAG: response regulator transcription factor [Candidatus Marinimicrobia bacterium]|jgi:OmpR-family two-component system manganese-sensing response regulator|nr:response regulator transcription factor [Candidatus Neomarinimicrobiota bacterium]MBT3630776.1 response regulator transcription factor [Candidatus Neomarinimicrobiota bacterium]MBT3825578.1 response regulator transcription factor [Candidatus Neomarinimicrobiota bacterium]MBT4131202.1 response regulator transcription factor [Candidatus Neomarinimicrobiota bacterium]MBT4296338.1 response regulator transcription factor [Candidatus Neomarinimicrobiota bacterium]
MMKILLVEDEKRLAQHLGTLLRENKYSVTTAYDGKSAWEIVTTDAFDAIILDWLLPEISGVEICERLRQKGDKTPILFLTAQSAIHHRIKGFESGADDYLTKPFNSEELLIRLASLIRRSHQPPISIFDSKGFTFDATKHYVYYDGKSTELSQKESAILNLLFQHPGDVISRKTFLQEIWGYDFDPKTNTLEVYIRMLRTKLDQLSSMKLIYTKRGEGYYIENEA